MCSMGKNGQTRDGWRLQYKTQPTSVEITQGRGRNEEDLI